MRKKTIKAYLALQNAVQRGISTLKSNKGDSHTVAVIVLIIGSIIIGGAVIVGLTVLFRDILIPLIQNKIEDLFNAV